MELSEGDMNLILQAVQAFADQREEANGGVEQQALRDVGRRLGEMYRLHSQSYLLTVKEY